jgi:acyl carrier protein
VETEERMTRLWTEVFGRPVRAGQDFFLELGGDSVRAVELIDAIVTEFDADVSLADLFDHPTPAEMTAVVDTSLAGERAE